MAARTDTEVIIGGKVLKLCGNESEEYLQKVASYLNSKLSEYSKMDSFRRQTIDIQNILLQLNIADDFFKAKEKIQSLEEEIRLKSTEVYDLKHQLVNTKVELEKTAKNLKDAEELYVEAEKEIIRLEALLKDNM